MRLELKREPAIGNAIPGELYADGFFFGYTLENAEYSFPSGVYDLYARESPKHGWKVHVRIPNRQNIMFHGANVPAELLGCIGISYSRPTKGTLFGDLSSELWDEFEKGGKNGVLIVTNAGEEIDTGKRFFLVVAIAGALLLLKRNKNKGGYNG